MDNVRKNFLGLFFLYCMLLAELLLIGRESDFQSSVKAYFILHANVIPFKTLIRYISFFAARRDFKSFLLAFSNIGGNFFLFFPMGFFLPVLFKKMRKFKFCFSVVFCMILSAELLQGVCRVGVPDIDDLMINLFGAYIAFCFQKSLFSDERCHRKSITRIHLTSKKMERERWHDAVNEKLAKTYSDGADAR